LRSASLASLLALTLIAGLLAPLEPTASAGETTEAPSASTTEAAAATTATGTEPTDAEPTDTGAADAPDWAYDARIFHVFTDRFRDGDPDTNVDVDPDDDGTFSEALRNWMGGDLAGVKEGLDHIEDAGFDTIWLGPVTPGPEYHGYHPTDYLDVGEGFGDLDALRDLIDEVHDRDMRIVYDLVPNHTSDQHPWFEDALEDCEDSDYYDWYTFTECDAGAEEYEYETFFGIEELPELDLDHEPARDYFLDVVVPFYLTDETVQVDHDLDDRHGDTIEGLGIDGFRLDHAEGPSVDFWEEFVDAADDADPDAFLFGEVFDGDRDTVDAYADVLGGAVNFPLHFTFGDALTEPGGLAAIDQAIRDDEATYRDGLVNPSFLDNHDVERFVDRAGGGEDGRARLAEALTLQYALPDPPSVYTGTEIGMGQTGSGPINDDEGFEDRWYREPFPWTDDLPGGTAEWEHADEVDGWTLQDPDLDVLDHVSALGELRGDHEALTHGDYETVRATDPLLAFERVTDDQRVLALLHDADEAGEVSLAQLYGELADDVELTDLLTGETHEVSDGDLTVGLEPMEAALFEIDGDLPPADEFGQPGGPSAVTIAGDFQGEDAFPDCGEWDPSCAATELTWSDADQAWEATLDLPEGEWEYKAVTERAWDVGTDFPEDDRPITVPEGGAEVTFLVDADEEYVLDTENDEIVTAVGDFQPQLGCEDEWDPACLRTWLQDPERDGVYEATFTLDADDYEGKVTVGRSFDEEYPGPGEENNLDIEVPEDGTGVTFALDREEDDPDEAVTVDVADPDEPDIPEDQPDQVVIASSFQDDLGCEDAWDPACTETALEFDEVGQHWEATFALPAGEHEYKAALDGSWEENYGADSEFDGANIELDLEEETEVTFLYGHDITHVMDDHNREVVTAPGDYQSQIGCEQIELGTGDGDWEPACMRSWLADTDGDGEYARTVTLDEGSYDFKVAIDRSWDENYGVGGEPDGADVPFDVPEDDTDVTFRWDPDDPEPIAEVDTDVDPDPALDEQRAHWLAQHVVAWPDEVPPDHTVTLHGSEDAGLAVEDGQLTGADTSVALTVDDDGLDPDLIDDGWRHLGEYAALEPADPDALDRDTAEELLRGELAVTVADAEGEVVDASGVQIPGVLDDLYADDAAQADLGVSWEGQEPTLSLWAPTAHEVTLHRFDEPQPASADDPTGDAIASHDLDRDDDSGVWSVDGDATWDRDWFLYEVTVYTPDGREIVDNVVTDPYSHSLSMDSARSQIVDLDDADLKPGGWQDLDKPTVEGNPSIYELHVRDFSSADPSVPEEDVGTYAAFTHDDTHGSEHLEALADAGLTHLHLLPTNDIATIPEDPDDVVDPEMPDRDEIRSEDPASEEPQAIQQETADDDPFNWGYDPLHFTAPQGSYSTDPDSTQRILEFREMVQALNEDRGLRVVKDVVYNHTHAWGQDDQSVLDRVVPGYYQRLDETGDIEDSTCCPNTASEHQMMEELMVDSVVDWVRHYQVDGFRFDLMGHHTKENMERVRDELDDLTVEEDGVDGSEVILYGEGWNFGEVENDRQFDQATQQNMAGTETGTFNDRLRDAVRGGAPFAGITEQGFATGLGTDANETDDRDEDGQRDQALQEQLLVQLGMAGNLADYELTGPDGEPVRGEEVEYGGAPGAGYAESPLDNVVYVSKHDNETLFDAIQLKAPEDLPVEERVRMQNLALSTVAFSQGTAFFHAGSDLLRSKSLDRNSFNSGDWFNRLDWTKEDNNFGVGLPPEAYNAEDWDLHEDVLETRPSPETDHIALNAAVFREWLEIRGSSDLFHLDSAEAVQEQVDFHVDGQDAEAGLIVMELSDGDPDDGFTDALVVFNAGPEETVVDDEGIAEGDWELHEVQQDSADDRVREASYDADDHAFTVPGRTTAVFVEPEDEPEVESDLTARPGEPRSGQPLQVHLELVDDAGDAVVGEAITIRSTDAEGTEETVEARALPNGRYLARLEAGSPGTSEIEALDADGETLDAIEVEVRAAPGGQGRPGPPDHAGP